MRDSNTPAKTGGNPGEAAGGTLSGTLPADSGPQPAPDDLQAVARFLAGLSPEQRAQLIDSAKAEAPGGDSPKKLSGPS